MLEPLVSDLNKLCDEQPFHAGWYLKDLRTGATADRYGHVTVCTEHLPVELPNGLPGHTVAVQLIGRLGRVCFDALRVNAAAAR